MSNKLRWGKFIWSDWSDDPALGLCSHRAQSVWMRLLCIMVQGTPYGHCTINGKPADNEQLGKLMRPPLRPERMAQVITELERKGVAKRTPDGCLFSARLVTDWRLSGIRSSAGTKGANARYGPKSDAFCHGKTENLPWLESESESEAEEKGSHRDAMGPLRVPIAVAMGDPDNPKSLPNAQSFATRKGGSARSKGLEDEDEDAWLSGKPRALGINPRALGTNPRATGTNPKATKDEPHGVDGDACRCHQANGSKSGKHANRQAAAATRRHPRRSVH